MSASLHRLRVPRGVAELIRGLHPQLKRKLGAALEEILKHPRSGKPLRDELVGLWSYRIGKFRLIYRIEHRQVDLIAFGPRDRIYEETYRLVARK